RIAQISRELASIVIEDFVPREIILHYRGSHVSRAAIGKNHERIVQEMMPMVRATPSAHSPIHLICQTPLELAATINHPNISAHVGEGVRVHGFRIAERVAVTHARGYFLRIPNFARLSVGLNLKDTITINFSILK